MYPTAKWLYAFPDSPVWNALPRDKGLDVADWIESGMMVEQVVAAVEEKRQAAPEVVQSVWQCLDSNNYQIGKWESKRIAITEEAEIEKWRKLSQSTPDVKYSRKSTDAEGNEYENFKIFTALLHE